MLTLQERLAGGLYGLLVGDALGVPYEFHSPQELPTRESIDMVPPRGFERSHHRTPPGTWSDDGALALCLLDSLLACHSFDPEDIGQRFLAFREKGYMAVDTIVFDIGGTTEDALDAIQRGTPALQAGRDDEWSQGNGSLMRVLPLVLWHRGDDAELATFALEQSRITHAHPSARACCILYCLWARRILDGIEPSAAWLAAIQSFHKLYPESTPERQVCDDRIKPDLPYNVRGSGFVIDTLHSARVVQDQPDYAAIVRAAIALGNDTDTTACVAGGIAGLRFGLTGIPAGWMQALRGQEIVAPLLEKLLAYRA